MVETEQSTQKGRTYFWTTPKGAQHHYWYYQLRATDAIFPKTKSENEYSRFQHLGKAGSQAHIDGVLAVIRRVQIDELTLCH